MCAVNYGADQSVDIVPFAEIITAPNPYEAYRTPVNEEDDGVPFSAAASVLTRSSGEKSQQPEPPASPEAESLAGNRASRRRTSTKAGASSGQ